MNLSHGSFGAIIAQVEGNRAGEGGGNGGGSNIGVCRDDDSVMAMLPSIPRVLHMVASCYSTEY